MTTQPTQPETAQAPLTDRVSKLEGAAEQVNHRLAENTAAVNTLRTENQIEHQALRTEQQALRAENHAEHQASRAENRAEHQALRAENRAEHQTTRAEVNRLRADMNRQTLITVGVLGGLMALFNFLG